MVKHNTDKLGRYVDIVDGICRYAKIHKIDTKTQTPAQLVADVVGHNEINHKQLSFDLTRTIARSMQALYAVYRDHSFTHHKAVLRVRCALMAHCDALLEGKQQQGRQAIEALFRDWDRTETLKEDTSNETN